MILTLLVLAYLIYQTYKGYQVGFSKRIVNLIFAGIVFMLAIMLQNPIGNFIYQEVTGMSAKAASSGTNTAFSLQLYRFAAFFVLLYVLKQVSKIFKSWMPEQKERHGITSVFDHTAGALVSFIAAYFFMYVVLSILNTLDASIIQNQISSSGFLKFIINDTPGLSNGVFKTLFSISRTTA